MITVGVLSLLRHDTPHRWGAAGRFFPVAREPHRWAEKSEDGNRTFQGEDVGARGRGSERGPRKECE